ncbi:MAG: aquaporin [Gemmatimonadota bacterium]
MISAAGFTVLLFHPASPMPAAVPSALLRRLLMGVAMGLTAIFNIYSPWGKRSGAHGNPATTLTFSGLGKVSKADAAGYMTGQFVGALAGMAVATVVFGRWIGDPSVSYAVTLPGLWGAGAAFGAEVGISFLLMFTILGLVAHPRLSRVTGVVAGALVATFIALESPVSGMSMNPARTLGSAVLGHNYMALWIYFVAPPLGMLTAAVVRVRLGHRTERHCAKLHHDPAVKCPFCGCGG